MNDYWFDPQKFFNGQAWHTTTLTKLEYYELEYQRLKEKHQYWNFLSGKQGWVETIRK